MISTSVYGLGLLVSTFVSGAVAYFAWQNRPKPMATTLSVSMVAGAMWSGGLFVSSVVSRPATVVALFGVSMVGMALVVQWCFLVGLQFGGLTQYLTRRTVALLSIQPALAAVAMATNSRHWLFWSAYRTGEPSALSAARGLTEVDLGAVVVANGPGFMIQAVYAMVALLLMTVFIVRRLQRSGLYFRKQGVVILVGLCGPWLGFGLFLTGITAADWTPIGVGLLGSTLFVGIFRYGLTELRPVPGETVVRNLSTGVVIVTNDDRINHCNECAQVLLGVDADRELIGQPLSALIGDHPELVAASTAESAAREVTIETAEGQRVVSLTIASLSGDRTGSPGQPARLFELHDITAQKDQQRVLERQNERLEQFTGILSHDLRNPLSVARGRTKLLSDASDADEHTEPIREALARMEELIDETLALTRQGESVADREPVDLSAVATQSWEMVETPTATLERHDDVTVYGDPTRIQRALENLFRNAIDHNEADASLTVRVGATDDGWYVEDTGSGIPADERDEVFEPGVTTHANGTGFGLAIVDEIISAHDWEISVTESPEGGARFEITTTNGPGRSALSDREPSSDHDRGDPVTAS